LAFVAYASRFVTAATTSPSPLPRWIITLLRSVDRISLASPQTISSFSVSQSFSTFS
jgi:hypothetical protein